MFAQASRDDIIHQSLEATWMCAAVAGYAKKFVYTIALSCALFYPNPPCPFFPAARGLSWSPFDLHWLLVLMYSLSVMYCHGNTNDCHLRSPG
jgi:hypothetical protein